MSTRFGLAYVALFLVLGFAATGFLALVGVQVRHQHHQMHLVPDPQLGPNVFIDLDTLSVYHLQRGGFAFMGRIGRAKGGLPVR